MLRRNLRRFAAALLMTAASAASAEIRVDDARLRLLPGDLPAAGYFRLENTGDRQVVLTGAHSPAYASVRMHRSMILEGQALMNSVSQLAIPANNYVEFEPGGFHLMLSQPQHPLDVGDIVEVTLEFEDGWTLPIDFRAASPYSP